jgi:hypothetical protein
MGVKIIENNKKFRHTLFYVSNDLHSSVVWSQIYESLMWFSYILTEPI